MLLFNLFTNPLMFLGFIIALLVAITIHEYAHAWTANFYGDSTAKSMGRLTLNPLAHLDVMGTIFLLLAGFGWGKPVIVNQNNFKNPKLDNLTVSLAGPFSNLLLAVTLGLIYRFISLPPIAEEFLSNLRYNPAMNVTRIFETQSRQLRLSHAYLIIGKFDVKRLLDILKIKGPDLLELKETPLKISSVRELIHWMALKPHSSPRKLAIIYEAQLMTSEAANALLKTLEEPPPDSILVLKATTSEKILPTIISRCQSIKGEQPQKKENLTDYQSPAELGQKNLKERFDYAAKIYESENFEAILDTWEEYFSNQLLKGQDRRDILRKIFKTRSLLLTNASVKLLLENLLLDFSK